MASRLMEGSLILLFYLLMNVVAAFITNGSDSSTFSDACSTSNDVTTCESAGKASFFSALADVTVTGFDGAPDIVNALWVVTGVFLLSMGILLIVLAFIPTTSA